VLWAYLLIYGPFRLLAHLSKLFGPRSSPISRHRFQTPTLSSLVSLQSFPWPHKRNHRRRSFDLHRLKSMSVSDEEDECFARFLESEVSSV